MNYEEALSYIHKTNKFGSVLGLDNIKILLELLGNPQQNLKVIHIAGTNGKGSISTMLSAVLTAGGYKTGLYTSPFLEKFNERIKINGKDISDEDIATYISKVKQKVDCMTNKGFTHPTEFEIITAMAFLYFKDMNVDFLILEVGLGGRLDATNVINSPVMSIISSISFDHTEYLGNTLKEIAYEKGGIIKKNSNVILYPSDKEAINELIRIAKEKNSKYYIADEKNIEIIKTEIDGSDLFYNKENNLNLSNFHLGLLGKHQIYNTLTVIKALEVLKDMNYNIDNKIISKTLKNIKFPGRFELLNKNPYIILDGGHNKEGIENFVNNIKLYFEDKKITLFFGMLADKDIDNSLKKLLTITKKIYTLTPNNNRAYTNIDMCNKIKQLNSDVYVKSLKNIDEALEIIKNNKEEIYGFVGSLYLIGEARTALSKILK